ncbi:bifunctional lysine-specific demethylase and histidyl-hydroxylase NO66-like isoform X3 [Poeciliopsis prolifica]|uniref:bifunctional lysine-specific demethylase and histidyl-hydroxylase NO66-like isoform X3 n=1 Tax=Poeciliopsis prolifica TaxID=188132 RepID=UPI0024140D94|nr:bifunctional lysine-specific demethylase and histidyl-hydroxylase NO66-like isoform X3 [Poeciliopsis prolifica]
MDDQRRLLDFTGSPQVILHRKVQSQRKFINQQLTPAEQTDPGFEEVIVKSEDELDDQSSLLDFSQEDVHQDDVWKEEALADQERSSSFDEEDPEPLQIKEEKVEFGHLQIKEEDMELLVSQDEEQLELKEESDTFMVTPTDEESFHTEPEPNWYPLDSQDSLKVTTRIRKEAFQKTGGQRVMKSKC